MQEAQVKITPYPATDAIPAGWKLATKGYRSALPPMPMPYNWYSRHEDVSFDVFDILATSGPAGVSAQELYARYPVGLEKVAKALKHLKSGSIRYTGWDLVTNDQNRLMLIYRDPRTVY